MRLEFAQRLAQHRPDIFGAHQTATLQRRRQSFANLVDEATADALERRADQETVAADLLHRLAHSIGNLVGRADQVEAIVVAFRGELPQSLAAAPLLELVERTRLAVGGQFWQRLIKIETREIDVGYLADPGDGRFDIAWIVDQPPVLLFRILPSLAQKGID